MTGLAQKDILPATLYEKSLAVGAMILFALVAAALIRGRGEWAVLDPLVWAHLATVLTPLALTPVQLLRRHGDRMHRVLGWI